MKTERWSDEVVQKFLGSRARAPAAYNESAAPIREVSVTHRPPLPPLLLLRHLRDLLHLPRLHLLLLK